MHLFTPTKWEKSKNPIFLNVVLYYAISSHGHDSEESLKFSHHVLNILNIKGVFWSISSEGDRLAF